MSVCLLDATSSPPRRSPASRLVVMDASTRNTEHMLETRIDLERRERQAEISREVLERIGPRFAGERINEEL